MKQGKHQHRVFFRSVIIAASMAVFFGMSAVASAAPDLTVSAVTPVTATPGVAQTFSATVTNTGNTSTGASFSNFFQVNSAADGVESAANGGGTITDLPATTMTTLSAGGSNIVTKSYLYPTTATPFYFHNTYSIRACADKSSSGNAGVITETNADGTGESNNCGEWTNVTVGKPLSFSDSNQIYGASPSAAIQIINDKRGNSGGWGSGLVTFFRGVAIADFNGDGKLDKAEVGYSSDVVSVSINIGDDIYSINGYTNPQYGKFSAKVDYATGDFPGFVRVGDFNGDGKPDMVVGNQGTKTISIFINKGDGTFDKISPDLSTGYRPITIAASDLNGDGKADIVVATSIFSSSGSPDTVYVFISKGDGTFYPKVGYSTLSSLDDMAVGDLDDDGNPDILVVDGGSAPNLSIFFNKGNGTFDPQFEKTVIAAPVTDSTSLYGDSNYAGAYPEGTVADMYDVAIGDLNGDGKLDIVATTWLVNILAVFINDGTGKNFPGAYTYLWGGPMTGPVILAYAGSDSKLDIYAYNNYGYLLLNTTPFTTGTVNVSSDIASSWTITGPATITGSGTSQTNTAKPPGTYTITWGAVAGYPTPPSQSLTLTAGNVITFVGNYIRPDLRVTSVPTITSVSLSGSGTVFLKGVAVNSGGNIPSGNVIPKGKFQIDQGADGTYDIDVVDSAVTSLTDLTASVGWSSPYLGKNNVRFCIDIPPDPNGNVAESNENNNCGDDLLMVDFTDGLGADLTADMTSPATAPTAGAAVTFSGTVANESITPADTNFDVRFQIEPGVTGTFTSAGVVNLDTITVSAGTFSSISGSPLTRTSLSWTVPLIEQAYRVRLCADIPTNKISETDEDNNCSAPISFAIGKPDLLATSVNFDRVLAVGDAPITFAANILNQGGPTAGAAQVRYRIADLSGSYTSAGATTLLSASNAIPSGLASFDTMTVTSPSYTLPATAGAYNLEVCADSPTSAVSEVDEDNNCKYDSITVAAAAPPAPATVAATTGSCPSPAPEVSWSNVPSATYYLVKRGTLVIGTVYSPDLSYTDTTATEGATYTYKVASGNDGGQSTYKSATSVTVPTCAAAPTVSLTAIPGAVVKGQSTRIYWNISVPIATGERRSIFAKIKDFFSNTASARVTNNPAPELQSCETTSDYDTNWNNTAINALIDSAVSASITQDTVFGLSCENTAGVSTAFTMTVKLTQCSDATDNDFDGMNNEADPNCYDVSGSYDPKDNLESGPLTQCSDGIDNNSPADGKCDAMGGSCSDGSTNPDLGCTSVIDDSEGDSLPATACSDNLDNDHDGRVDSGGLDANGDGDLSDIGDKQPDPGCLNAADNNEFNLKSIRPS